MAEVSLRRSPPQSLSISGTPLNPSVHGHHGLEQNKDQQLECAVPKLEQRAELPGN